jgi:hypothetical protein
MERGTWTDERLDDLARRMDSGFDRLDRDIRELRSVTIRFGGGIMVALVGVIAAILSTA